MSVDSKEQRIRDLEKENTELKHFNEILQEVLGFSQYAERSKSHQRYSFIYGNQNKHWTIKLMCKILGVSTSSYYKYRKNIGRPEKDAILSAAIEFILNKSPFNDNYGAPRMQLTLQQRGLKAGIRRNTRIMTDGFIDHVGDQKALPMLQQKFKRKKI